MNPLLAPTNQDKKTQKAINALLADRAQSQFGLSPYEPGYNFPQDLGLGGISTEYTATDTDQNGEIFNYPQIWYTKEGEAQLIPESDAYQRALAYEESSGKRFPRFNSFGNAETYAAHR